jgi:hypothetical protein
MSSWGCPHEIDGKCQRVLNRPCDIGMKGCVLAGRFKFADPSKNRTNTPTTTSAPPPAAADDDSKK